MSGDAVEIELVEQYGIFEGVIRFDVLYNVKLHQLIPEMHGLVFVGCKVEIDNDRNRSLPDKALLVVLEVIGPVLNVQMFAECHGFGHPFLPCRFHGP